MSGIKDVFKGGWHPGGKGGWKESWRGDNKGINQIAGLVGRGKQSGSSSSYDQALNHQSAPLSTLKDPSSFGPPPKHVHYHGAQAAPDRTTPDRRGLGAPATPRRRQESHDHEQTVAEEANEPPEPPATFRADTTGLSTAHLPKPPKFGAPAVASPRSNTASSGRQVDPLPKPKSKPSLPPRLPPRQNSYPDEFTPAAPPSYNETISKPVGPSGGELNQGALNRLGRAGVSVQGFNIGHDASPPHNIPTTTARTAQPSVQDSGRGPQLNELQSRFARMSTSANSPSKTTSGHGTTFAQKQQALKTASNFRNDPSSVSLADARNAASTANSFRERHGEQVASGWKTANGLNQKYGVVNKVNSFNSGPATAESSTATASSPTAPSPAAPNQKRPPPPPPKKKEQNSETTGAPPPVPLGSKPRF